MTGLDTTSPFPNPDRADRALDTTSRLPDADRALDTAPRFPDPDRAYRALIEAHRGLPDEASALLNTRLVLILANHIGDLAVLTDAIALAKQAMPAGEPAPEGQSSAPSSNTTARQPTGEPVP